MDVCLFVAVCLCLLPIGTQTTTPNGLEFGMEAGMDCRMLYVGVCDFSRPYGVRDRKNPRKMAVFFCYL